MTESIKKFFREYEKAIAALDIEKTVAYFADSFILAGPRGAIAPTKAEFLELSQQANQFYRSVGRTSAKILSLDETPISNEFSMVNTHWGLTFQKTGDRVIESDITFLVQKTGSEPKIITFIDHQDSEKTYQELGLTSA